MIEFFETPFGQSLRKFRKRCSTRRKKSAVRKLIRLLNKIVEGGKPICELSQESLFTIR